MLMSIKSAPVSNSFIINILIFRFHFFPSFLSTVVNQVYQHKLDDNPLVNTELNLVSSFQVQRIKRETAAAAAAKSLKSCPTLCDPRDGSPLDSVRPQRRQPIRLPRPWDSPGKNTGVGCHFLLQCMKVKSESEVTQ